MESGAGEPHRGGEGCEITASCKNYIIIIIVAIIAIITIIFK